MSKDEIYISSITLNNYRNFDYWHQDIDNKSVLLLGENGTGKTNILESLSLLSQGRGLKSCKFDEICSYKNNNIRDTWSSEIVISNNIGSFEIVSSFHRSLGTRKIDLNGKKVSSKELGKLLNIVWLVPEMHHIFTGPRSGRLKFYDRIVFNFYPKHASLLNKYDYYLRERRTLLKSNYYDQDWVAVLEKSLAELSVEIVNNRLSAMVSINNMPSSIYSSFPHISLSLDCKVLNLKLNDEKEYMNIIMSEFRKSRELDIQTSKSNFGIHKADLVATHLEVNQKASNCSMGQQKAVLISIIISQIFSLIDKFERNPIILLDEVFVHLDKRRAGYLCELLLSTNSNIWVSDTDSNNIEYFANKAKIINL